MRNTRSKQIALGGVFAALAILFMLIGSFLPIATFMAPIFAGICLIPLAIELGAKTALLAYLAVSLLSLFLVADREMALFFIFLFGYYPILHPRLQKIKHKAPRVFVKLLLFNATVAAVYSLLLFLFTVPALREEFSNQAPWFWGLVLVVGNITFLVYDILVDKMRFVYVHHVRDKIIRR